MISYVQNQEDDPKFVYYDKKLRKLEVERTMTIDSSIQLIKSFSCASSLTNRYTCAIISSGNFISEHVFEFNEVTTAVKELQQYVFNPYKDFSAESVKLNGNFFIVNGFSSSLSTNSLLAYKLRSSGGSEWLYAGIPYSRFQGMTLDNTKFEVYASPNKEKNLLFAFPPNSKAVPFFLLGGIRVQPMSNQTEVSGIQMTFPQAPSKNVIVLQEYFTSISSTPAAQPTSTQVSENSLTIGFILLIILLILLILFGALILVDYFKTGTFGIFKFFTKLFKGEETVKTPGKGSKLTTGEWEVGVMDHSADIGRDTIMASSRF